VGLDKIVSSRKDDTTLGFGGKVRLGENEADYSMLDDVKPQDLTKFGLIPEFVGRLPIVVNLDPLGEDALVKILTEPKNALTKQYSALLETEGIQLEFSDEAIDRMSSLAVEVNSNMENIGARRLHTIIETLLEDISFAADEHKGEKITINSDYVDEKLSNIVENRDLSKYIL
jgi:ATP-dependent HslUV protease ATP-binding subunit HslU